jgi:hypothetical protein
MSATSYELAAASRDVLLLVMFFFGKMGGADPLWLATHTTAE